MKERVMTKMYDRELDDLMKDIVELAKAVE